MQQTIRAGRCGLVVVVIGALLQLASAAPAAAIETPQRLAILAQGSGYESPQGSADVRQLQRRLSLTGDSPGPIDGRFGPLTKAAVTRFQARERLVVDGLVGPQTRAALESAPVVLGPGAGYGDPRGSKRVRSLQRRLRLTGSRPGPLDGRFGPLTRAAVIRFQARQGLAVDGLVGEATHRALVVRAKAALKRAKDRELARATRPGSPAETPVPATRTIPAPSNGLATGWLIAIIAAAFLLGALALSAARRRRYLGFVRYHRVVDGSGRPEPLVGERVNAPRLGDGTNHRRGKPVFGYATVSPLDPHGEGEDFRAQAEAIVSECKRRNLPLLQVVREREPNHDQGRDRPGLNYALRRISAGEAQGLVVAELSRLGGSAAELGEVLDCLSRSRARLVAAAEGLDTAEQAGELAGRVLIQVSDWEHTRRGEHAPTGLEAARRKGQPSVADNPELQRRIARMRAEGMSLRAIANRLNEEGVPTVRGGAKWRASSVQAATGYHRPRGGRLAQTRSPDDDEEGEELGA
jgi:peptidoglycan hydrolase-like protein with peptidoglycan-binding domain/DNA invertase Pin-like site-specific DNA recombinase